MGIGGLQIYKLITCQLKYKLRKSSPSDLDDRSRCPHPPYFFILNLTI